MRRSLYISLYTIAVNQVEIYNSLYTCSNVRIYNINNRIEYMNPYFLLRLRLFRHFDPFRILVCSGDGSVGWVLSEIDRLGMHVSKRVFSKLI